MLIDGYASDPLIVMYTDDREFPLSVLFRPSHHHYIQYFMNTQSPLTFHGQFCFDNYISIRKQCNLA